MSLREKAASWAEIHPALFAVAVWATPVLLLSPVLFVVSEPLIALPMLLAGPVIPAAVAYGAASRSHNA